MKNVAVVGMGVIANVHIPIILNNNNVNLVSVCDIKEVDYGKFNLSTEVKYYSDLKNMLDNEQIDVLHICTPHYLHAEMIIEAVGRGVNVICEKPVVMNSKSALEVQSVLDESSARVGVVFQNRLNNSTSIMQDYLNNKKLGNLKGIFANVVWHRQKEYYTTSDWRGTYQYEGGGVLINQAIHTIDLVQLLGGSVESVSGNYSTLALGEYIEVEDSANMLINFSSGAKGYISMTNTFIDNMPVELELVFEQGSLKLINNKVVLITADNIEIIGIEETNKLFTSYFGPSHSKCINQFYESLENGSMEYISFEQATKVFELIDALRISNDEKRVVMIGEVYE